MKLELPIYHAIQHGPFPTSFTCGHDLAMKASVLAWDFPSSKSLECGSSGKDNQRDLRSRDAQDLLLKCVTMAINNHPFLQDVPTQKQKKGSTGFVHII